MSKSNLLSWMFVLIIWGLVIIFHIYQYNYMVDWCSKQKGKLSVGFFYATSCILPEEKNGN